MRPNLSPLNISIDSSFHEWTSIVLERAAPPLSNDTIVFPQLSITKLSWSLQRLGLRNVTDWFYTGTMQESSACMKFALAESSLHCTSDSECGAAGFHTCIFHAQQSSNALYAWQCSLSEYTQVAWTRAHHAKERACAIAIAVLSMQYLWYTVFHIGYKYVRSMKVGL